MRAPDRHPQHADAFITRALDGSFVLECGDLPLQMFRADEWAQLRTAVVGCLGPDVTVWFRDASFPAHTQELDIVTGFLVD